MKLYSRRRVADLSRYVRDLISGLRDKESYDRHQLALSAAAPLISRKRGFGNEVADHTDELANVLVGLKDDFDIENFDEMRQKALIALLVAQPAPMGQWLASAFFSGDRSVNERVVILSAIGLGAREVAGIVDKDAVMKAKGKGLDDSFPSKQLPERLHKIYTESASPVDAAAKRLERMMIEPVALDAADKMSGPNALKVRTFSSRMDVAKRRKKPIANNLAKIVAESFFFPLTGRWWAHAQT